MIALALALLATQVALRPDTSSRAVPPVTRDSADSTRWHPIPVTPALLASAFADSDARSMLRRARTARLAHDSTLLSYDATAYERLSVRVRVGPVPRGRLLMRTESAARVRWERGNGAVVDVTGARGVMPILGSAGEAEVRDDAADAPPVPYFPGRETMWIGSSLARASVRASRLIHPLASGAEAYYRYASGGSVAFRLPGGRRIVVRELRVTPRRASWNTAVGSLWFDVGTGQLVRAIYRMSEPMDVVSVARQNGEDPERSVPVWLRPMLFPIRGAVDVVTVDYGLYEGRYWLPRLQVVEGEARAGPMRFGFTLHERFDYSAVNTVLALPKLAVAPAPVDSARRRGRRSRARCTGGDTVRVSRESRAGGALPMLVRIPCDTAALARSPSLPASIYDAPDSVFAEREIASLADRTLSLGRQGEISPGRPELRYGLPLTRYNRIEGVSSGIEVRQMLGGGYTARGLARIGIADREPGAELSLARSNGRETYTAAVYRRLVAANDWGGGDPFSVGSSLSALVLGHDDGVYYRAWGAELVRDHPGGWLDEWRLFAERESGARVRTDFSFAGSLRARSLFPDNIAVTNASLVGLAVRKAWSAGDDPARVRLLSDVRAEGATGTLAYARAGVSATASVPVGGDLSAALTLAGGASAGTVPVQRLWYLGGSRTVRGQDVGIAVGDAFWLARGELALGPVFARPVLFADLGWAGDRHRWREGVVPVSGAGVGASFLDGLVRIDVAKAVRPAGGVRATMYVGGGF